jgi:hypothetical protein
MKFTSKPKDQPALSLEDKIRATQDACDKYIDGKAEELKQQAPEVPFLVLRNVLTARSNNCACAAALHNLSLED